MEDCYAQAGSLESGDVLVRIAIREAEGLSIRIASKVSPRFAKSIERSTQEVAAEMGIKGALVDITDRGALDFVLRARIATAFRRALGGCANG